MCVEITTIGYVIAPGIADGVIYDIRHTVYSSYENIYSYSNSTGAKVP